jgi:hypothetical protein
VILLGAPEVVVVDASARGPEVDRLLDELGLCVVPGDAHGITLGRPSVGLFGSDHPPVAGCYAWYVGTGACPTWMHPAPGRGALVLALLGTGFAQERAGAAFRAAGAGLAPPSSCEYDGPGTLGGISAAVAPCEGGVPPGLAEAGTDHLLRSCFQALDRCCAPSGAIAAAPPRSSPTEPDYGFFWQRDAAAVAIALHGLTRWGPDQQVRVGARTRLDGYVSFLAELGPRLAEGGSIAVSRCSLTGTPVEGYGNPQHDGPAATALVLLAVVEDPVLALAVARPFLDHLLSPAADAGGYDLWELVRARTFHATNLRRRALSRAALVAHLVGDPAGAAYESEAHRLSRVVNAFRDPATGCFQAMHQAVPRWFRALSGLDMAVVGSELLSADEGESRLGDTLQALERQWVDRWPVNAAWRSAGRLGMGMGRFPEDCNDGLRSTGGNPWPVTTLWAAQWHFRYGDRAVGQGFLDFVLAHSQDADLPEQVDGRTGEPRGARSLGWAQAELVTTLLARRSQTVVPRTR